MLIYKILRADEWSALQLHGETAGAPIDLADGFVHFSTADQAVETAAKHFQGAENLWLLAVDTDQLGDALKWEISRGDALFPHLYAPLRMTDLTWVKPLPLHEMYHLFPEEVSGFVDPNRFQFNKFKQLGREYPIDMLNLARLRQNARYPNVHENAGKSVTGAEAYAEYGRLCEPILARLGAEIVWRGQFQSVLIGADGEHWDHMFVARYPNAHAFLAMVTDPEYQYAVVHRQAAVRTSRLIRSAPMDTGVTFA